MSKGLGKKIAIKFTEDLVGDVTGLVPAPVAQGNYFRPIGVATGSSQYSSYAPSRAFDGSTSSYWYTRTTGDQWVQIELAEPTWIHGFRWYAGSSYRPNGFNFQGSNDGEIWEDILTNNSPNAAGWHEFPTDYPKQYKYYRWTVTSRYSSYLHVYEIELLGVAGNESAFTITGKEYQYVNGPLVDKEYQIEKVERYPTQRIWESGGELTLDYETLEAFWTDGEVVMPSAFFDLHLTENSFKLERLDSASTTNNTRHFIRFNVDLTNIDILTFEGSMSNRSYISSAVWIDGEVVWESSGSFERTENSIDVSSYSGACDIDFGLFTRNSSGIRGTVEFYAVKIDGSLLVPNETSYVGFKTHTYDKIDSSNQLRTSWLEDRPTGTNIIIEYTTGETQGQWQVVSNGDIITSDTNLWIRATLSTEDTTITPTLQDLWLEDADAPQDKILISMDQFDRFNNVKGLLTVEYDVTKGNLSGRGGAVESFTEEFTPTGLVQKPNPGPAENFKMTAATAVDFIKIEYNNRYAAENFKITAAATITLTFVGVVNP